MLKQYTLDLGASMALATYGAAFVCASAEMVRDISIGDLIQVTIPANVLRPLAGSVYFVKVLASQIVGSDYGFVVQKQ